VRDSGAPSVGDIVEVCAVKPRRGLVVGTKGLEVGILYFKPSVIQGTAGDFVWWIHRTHVRVISAA
jgi:hypothetical protein